MITTTATSITATIALPKGSSSGYSDTTTFVVVQGPTGTTTVANAAVSFIDSTVTTNGTLVVGNIPTPSDGVYRVRIYKTSNSDIDDSTNTALTRTLTTIKEFSVHKVTSVSNVKL